MDERERFAAGQPVSVVPVGAPDTPLDYLAPEGGVRVGALVEVPLGPRRVAGAVWGGGAGEMEHERLRAIIRVLDLPPLRAELRDFLTRAGDYTITPLPAMLRLATRAPGLMAPVGDVGLYRRGTGQPARMTPARARVLEVLEAHGGAGFPLGELADLAGVSASVVKGLLPPGAVIEEHRPRDRPYPALDPARPGPDLTPDQARAAARLGAGVRAGGFGVTLLKGVTGAGKTEVYLAAACAALAAGRQVLVLLPEIALTESFLARVEARFGARPGEWHSAVSGAERRRLWKMAATGGVQLVVGARSALFLPFRDLALIVVDEEHDSSYKQEDGVLYHARDMAVLRAHEAGARVILASATPSLESWVNAGAGKYDRLDLTDRYGGALMPEMRAIDMRAGKLPAGRWISAPLARAVEARLAAGEQALLFLNRRGYAPVMLCRACGHQIGCHQCDARLVEHRFRRQLICHRCGSAQPLPETCPACGAEGRLAAIGPGVERLAEEAATLFPDARQQLVSSDQFASAAALKEALARIAEGGAEIIIGTQIVAKGHHFPALTLVGVIDADLGLQGGDLRAAEHSFQLIRQVAGRAGRADRPGLALIQTYQPAHPVIAAILSGDDEGFWRAEAGARKAAGMPPFGRLAAIIISAPDAGEGMALAQRLARQAGPLEAIGADLWGPAPAPVARIRGLHRFRLLIRAPRTAPLQAAIRRWLAAETWPARIRLRVDIDPQSFF